MKHGDTFRVTQRNKKLDQHLWIVLSDPSIDASNVLIVNLTEWRKDKDQACILDVGDHPFITKKSCIYYPEAKVQQLDDLLKLETNRYILKHEPLSQTVEL